MTGLNEQIAGESALRAGHGKGMKSKILLKEMVLNVAAKYIHDGSYSCGWSNGSVRL